MFFLCVEGDGQLSFSFGWTTLLASIIRIIIIVGAILVIVKNVDVCMSGSIFDGKEWTNIIKKVVGMHT